MIFHGGVNIYYWVDFTRSMYLYVEYVNKYRASVIILTVSDFPYGEQVFDIAFLVATM